MKQKKERQIISVMHLRANLRDILRRVKSGQTFVVTAYGKPDAVIGPVETEK